MKNERLKHRKEGKDKKKTMQKTDTARRRGGNVKTKGEEKEVEWKERGRNGNVRTGAE